MRALQSRRIAHRRLVGDAVLLDRDGAVVLTDLRGGEIAAGDLVLRMDIAQLLTTLGLRVGAERSVAAAVEVLGPDAVADSLPLLQPIAMSRATRAHAPAARQGAGRNASARRCWRRRASGRARRGRARAAAEAPDRRTARAEKNAEKRALDEALEEAREEDLLAQIRRQVLMIRPQAAVEPARLERIQPAHPRHVDRGRVRGVLPAVADHPRPARQGDQRGQLVVGGRGVPLLGAHLRGGGDEPARVRPGEGVVPAHGAGAGRRFVREAGGAGGGRRRGAQHPLPAAGGGAVRAWRWRASARRSCSVWAATSCCC